MQPVLPGKLTGYFSIEVFHFRIEKHSSVFLFTSFIISGYAYIANPNLLNNMVFYAVLAGIFIQILGSIIKSRTWGVVKTKEGKVIPHATLELYSLGTGTPETKQPTEKAVQSKETLYTTTQADTHGRYQFTPENGDYTLKARDAKGKITYTKEVTVTDESPKVDVGVVS